MLRHVRICFWMALIWGVGASLSAVAQQQPAATPGEEKTASQLSPEDAKPGDTERGRRNGLPMGPFRLDAGATLTESFDDNIYATPTDRISDRIVQEYVSLSRSGGHGALTQIRMRGGEANHVAVFIDGVKVNDPSQSSEFDFSQLLTDDVERIEVIRGPQSALWGSDALAGVVNIVSARPRDGAVNMR